MQANDKLRIAIVGAGIGGLTFAVALQDASNVEIDIYESASQISEIGAGVGLWPRTWAALKQMGLEPDLTRVLGESSDNTDVAFEYRKGDQPEGHPFHKFYLKKGMLAFHRHDLQQVLFNHIPKACRVHLNHRLVSYIESEDEVLLAFQNGSRAVCDLLVGADGIRSVVRAQNHLRFGNESAAPYYTGTSAFRGLIPAGELRKRDPTHRTLTTAVTYVGKNAHLVVYPISQGQIINVVAFYSDPDDEGQPLEGPVVREATQQEMMNIYKGWEPEVQTLLEFIRNPSHWAIQALHPLDSYVTRRVALLGDAAHAMKPHLGAGAGQSMEDAWILGMAISHMNSRETLTDILWRYNAIRSAYANKILRDARNQGLLYELNAPGFEHVRKGEELSEEGYQRLSKKISENWEWVGTADTLLADGEKVRR